MTETADIASLKAQVAEANRRIAVLESEVGRLEEAERAKWKAGIYAMGTVVLGLLGVIWQYRGAIFGGKQ